MNDNIKSLLAPVSAEQPCGPDLSNDPAYDELTQLAKGKPEVEIGSVQRPAEPPDWRELRSKSAVYLTRSKHLGIAIMHVSCLTRMDGVAGFNDGLGLIQGLLEQFWPSLHPQLDPEDNNDPTQRLNLIGGLTTPRGQISGWIQLLDYLYASEICRPKGSPPITFEQLIAAKAKTPGAPELSKLAAAITDAGIEAISARQQLLVESLDAAKAIDQFLTTTLGSTNTIGFETLLKSLQELISLLAPYVAGDTASAESSDDGSNSGSSAEAGTSSLSVRGSVKSREDVVRSIDAICEYYRQVEPGSPVPYLLRRAQKMVRMNFVEAMHELSLATVDTLRPSMGSAVESAAPTNEAPPA